jgi:hypothetical protein
MASSPNNGEGVVHFDGQDLPERMGMRPLARALGIAHTTLNGYWQKGFVSRGDDKMFDVAEVIRYRASIPEDVKEKGKAAAAAPKKERREVATAPPPGDDAIPDDGTPGIAVSKARKEHWLAEQARIRAEKAMGDLITREAVEASLEAIGSEIVTNLRNLAPKLRPYMTDEGKKVLDRSIDAALRDIAKKLEDILEADDGDD